MTAGSGYEERGEGSEKVFVSHRAKLLNSCPREDGRTVVMDGMQRILRR
jgi:hypothetical protein